MWQRSNVQRSKKQTEIEMKTESIQRILLHEHSQHRDRRPCRCWQDQPD